MGTFGPGSWWINEQPGHRNSPSGPGLDQRLEETEHSEKVSKKCDRAAESTTVMKNTKAHLIPLMQSAQKPTHS